VTDYELEELRHTVSLMLQFDEPGDIAAYEQQVMEISEAIWADESTFPDHLLVLVQAYIDSMKEILSDPGDEHPVGPGDRVMALISMLLIEYRRFEWETT